jgi:hypothetical protein
MGMRLEVNHPLYALAWLGAGEVLCLYSRVMRDGGRAVERRAWLVGAAGVGAVVLVPAAIAVGGERVFLVRDPLLWGISTRYVAESQSLWDLLPSWQAVPLVLPIAWLLVPAFVLLRVPLRREERVLLVLGWIPAALGWMLGGSLIHWLGLAWALTLPLVAMHFIGLQGRYQARPRFLASCAVAAGLLFAPGAMQAVRNVMEGSETTADNIRQLAERDLAHWLRLRTGDEPAVVAAAPGATTWLLAYGGLRGLGTLYWENTPGLHKIGALYAAKDADAAYELVARWGVTHIVYVSWASLEVALVRETRGMAPDAPAPGDAFILQVLRAPVPPRWLRQIPYSLPEHPVLAGAQVRIFEVVADQTPAAATAHAASFFLESGQAENAGRLAPALSHWNQDLNAAVMLAAIASSQKDTAGFAAATARVIALIAQAEAMPLDDQVRLAEVLTMAQRLDLARERLEACLRKASARSLRQLTPGTLAVLLELTEALGVTWPEPGLEQLATQLLPPSRRD